jgi:uroporphyrinogen decarboxylase
MKPLLLQSIEGMTLERPPVWCMRQAGRYLPEYQMLRKQHSFNQLAETPDLAREITLQPLRRFELLDAAILFADILTPSRALGFDFEFSPGPILKNAVSAPEQIENLEYIPVQDSVPFVFEALSQVRNELENEVRDTRRAMLGFAASPWTLACYLIDQGIYKQHIGTKIFARKYPEDFHRFLSLLTTLTLEYLIEKNRSGADAVQIFDTWGTLLSPLEYEEFSGVWIRHIVQELKKRNIPVIVYISGGEQLLPQLSEIAPSVISVDWRCELSDIEI